MNFYFLVAKTIFYSLAALVRKILFCHSKIKFISSRHRVISSIYSAFFVRECIFLCSDKQSSVRFADVRGITTRADEFINNI